MIVQRPHSSGGKSCFLLCFCLDCLKALPCGHQFKQALTRVSWVSADAVGSLEGSVCCKCPQDLGKGKQLGLGQC